MKIFKFLYTYSLLFFFCHIAQSTDPTRDFLKQRNDEIYSLRQGLPDKNCQQQLNILKDETLNRATGNGYNLNLKQQASSQTQDEMRKVIHQSVTNDSFNGVVQSVISTTNNQSYVENFNYIRHLTWIVANYVKSWSMTINPSLCLNEVVGKNIYAHRMTVFKGRISIHDKSTRKQVKSHLRDYSESSFAKIINVENVISTHAELSRNMPDVDNRAQDYIYVRDITTSGYLQPSDQYIINEEEGIVHANLKDNRKIVEISSDKVAHDTFPKIIHQNKTYINFDAYNNLINKSVNNTTIVKISANNNQDYFSNLPFELIDYIFSYLKDGNIRDYLNLREISKYTESIISINHISTTGLKNRFAEIIAGNEWHSIIKKMHCQNSVKAKRKLEDFFGYKIYCFDTVYNGSTTFNHLIRGKWSTKNLINYNNSTFLIEYMQNIWGKYFHPDRKNKRSYLSIKYMCEHYLQHVNDLLLKNQSTDSRIFINLAYMLIYSLDFQDSKSKVTSIDLLDNSSKKLSELCNKLRNQVITKLSDNKYKDNVEIQCALALMHYFGNNYIETQKVLSQSQLKNDNAAQHLHKLISIENDLINTKNLDERWYRVNLNIHGSTRKPEKNLKKWLAKKHFAPEECSDYGFMNLSLKEIIHTYVRSLYWLDQKNITEVEQALWEFADYGHDIIKQFNDRPEIKFPEDYKNAKTAEIVLSVLKNYNIIADFENVVDVSNIKHLSNLQN